MWGRRHVLAYDRSTDDDRSRNNNSSTGDHHGRR